MDLTIHSACTDKLNTAGCMHRGFFQLPIACIDGHFMGRPSALQIFETQEMLGLYGKSPTSHGNYYIATGDCGHILTGGTLAGMIISGTPLCCLRGRRGGG